MFPYCLRVFISAFVELIMRTDSIANDDFFYS